MAAKGHKYVVISKVGNEKFVKYRTTNLIKFYKFIVAKFPNYRYSNVYSRKSHILVMSFTKKRPPL